MKKIDFISTSPSDKLSIFSESRNKTNLGGFVFVIEIISIFLIFFIYLFDHFNNLPYTIETNTIFETKSGVINPYNEKLFDKEMKFDFNIYTDYGNEVSDKFEIVDFSLEEYSTPNYRKKSITRRPSKLKLAVYYKCHNATVCKYFEKGNVDQDYTKKYYRFKINYPGFIIAHQAPIPIQDKSNIILSEECPFLFDTITLSKFHWKNIKYEEDGGMWSRLFNKYILGKEPDFYANGYIETATTFPVEIEENWIYALSRQYKLVAIIEIDNNIYSYTNYRRTPNSIFTTIANIAALISTVNYLLATFVQFYSRNYDNYTIIKSIVSSKKNLIENNLKQNKDINDFGDKKEENNIPLINNESEMFINEIGQDIEKKVDDNYDKINFVQFFWNNFYFSGCKKTKEQEIIKLCNEIICKYLSVDNLLYNQIIIENLLEDYKWNNPDLYNIKKNKLLSNFKI